MMRMSTLWIQEIYNIKIAHTYNVISAEENARQTSLEVI